MNAGAAIYKILKDDSAVGAIIGDKIYPSILPQKLAYPAVTYKEVDQSRELSKDGPYEHTYDLSIYSLEYKQAQNIASAIKTALNKYTGTVNSVDVELIQFTNQSDDPFEEPKELFQIEQTYTVLVGG